MAVLFGFKKLSKTELKPIINIFWKKLLDIKKTL